MRSTKLLIVLFISSLGLVGSYLLRKEEETDYHELQIEAVNKTQEAFNKIKAKRLELGIPIDSILDPLETGMIGQDLTIGVYSITTTVGKLEAKRTSTNPNFTALLIRYLKSLNIKKGDSVALNFSGSFPAINIEAMIAVQTLELNSFVCSSIGASMFGANFVGFNYLDMELHLFDEGLLHKKSDLVSLGGENDNLDMTYNDDSFKYELYNRYFPHYEFLRELDYNKNIDYRYGLYNNKLGNIKAFINVGGNLVSNGKGLNSYPNGLTRRMSVDVNRNSGLIELFLRDDVPLINLLNIEDLAARNEMEYDSNTLYEIGVGSMYYDFKYPIYLIIIPFVLCFGFMGYDNIKRKEETIGEIMIA